MIVEYGITDTSSCERRFQLMESFYIFAIEAKEKKIRRKKRLAIACYITVTIAHTYYIISSKLIQPKLNQ